jgi:hypothetical protein
MDTKELTFFGILKATSKKIRIRNIEYGSKKPDPFQYVTDPEHFNVQCLCEPVLRIRDVYPGSRILIFTHPGSRISDPKTATKERDEKNLLYFFCSHKFHKIEYYFIFEMMKKKILANY